MGPARTRERMVYRETDKRQPGRSGFTLVELIVVIAIIAVLIALLAPCLSRARAQARTVQCMSNMRQVGLALLSYADAHEGYLYPDDMGWNKDHVGPVYPDNGSLSEYHNVWPLVVFGTWNPPIMIC